jgi:hypothetical protein
VEDLGIEAHRETERQSGTHTYTHTHNFSEGKKRNKRDEDLQKGPEFGCVFCKGMNKKNLTTIITTPQLENTVFLWFFLPLLHLCFWVLIIYLFLRWEKGVEILLARSTVFY